MHSHVCSKLKSSTAHFTLLRKHYSYDCVMLFYFLAGKQFNNITPSTAVLQQHELNIANLSNIRVGATGPVTTVVTSAPLNNQTKVLNSAQSMPALPTTMTTVNLRSIRHHAHCTFSPMAFHQSVMGKNVSLSPDQCTALRAPGEYCNAYVFTHRPLECGECLVIQVSDKCAIHIFIYAKILTLID